jgi:hypothetical protein
MVQFVLERGRKSEGDFVIKVYSYGEVWSLEHILRLLKIIFESENANYPLKSGKRGACLLLHAITEIAFGRDIELVLRDYQLKRKSVSKVQIIENLGSKLQAEPIQKLHEILE